MALSIAKLMFAISMSASTKLPQVQVKSFAEAIQKQSIQTGINDLLFIAIAEHESHFYEGAISKDGFDVGLLQIRAKNVGGDIARLLNGVENIRVGAYLLKLNRDFCEKQLGRAPEEIEWLSCYAGQCTTKQNFCKPSRMTRQIEYYRECLEREIETEQDQKCGTIYHGEAN